MGCAELHFAHSPGDTQSHADSHTARAVPAALGSVASFPGAQSIICVLPAFGKTPLGGHGERAEEMPAVRGERAALSARSSKKAQRAPEP